MAPTIVRFPYDITGRNRNNFVPGEVHVLANTPRRIIVPKYGAFYGDSVVLLDTYTQKPLEHGIHYVFDSLRKEVTAESRHGAFGLIVVIDPAVSDIVALDYQAVGSPYDTHEQDALRMAQILKDDQRAVSVGNIMDLPSAFPGSKHFQSLAAFTNFDGLAHSIERLRMIHNLGARLEGDVVYQYAEHALADLSNEGADLMSQLMGQHKVDPDAHPQYIKITEIAKYIALIKKPVNTVPNAGQTNVPLDVTLQASKYLSLYRKAQQSVQFQISTTSDFSGTPVVDITIAGTTDTYHYTDVLASSKVHYWRCRYTDIDGAASAWSDITGFTTMAVSVAQPIFLSPTNNDSSNSESPTLTASNFGITGALDTHLSSDWEVWTGPNGTGELVWSKVGDTVNKTSVSMPLRVLTRLQTYYPRVRYRATKYGNSPWSTGAAFFATWQLRPVIIGQSFGGGFWGGDIVLSDGTYAIIVAPKATGETKLALTGANVLTPGSADLSDSVVNTNYLATLTGVNKSAAAAWAKALTIGTYTDWCVPANDVMTIVQSKLGSAVAAAPAPWKAGGVEVWQNAQYWSSTTYDWLRDDSYTSGGDPIYQSKTEVVQRARSFSYGPTGESVNYSSYVKCNAGEVGPSSVSGPAFTPSGGATTGVGGVRTGYWSAYWLCGVTTTTSSVVGYTPTVRHTVMTQMYQAKAYNPYTGVGVANVTKTTQLVVRAVRLVKVA